LHPQNKSRFGQSSCLAFLKAALYRAVTYSEEAAEDWQRGCQERDLFDV
jgi:hypothetical protein